MKNTFYSIVTLMILCFNSKAQVKESSNKFFHHHISICQFTSTIEEDYFFILNEDMSFVFGKISSGYTGKTYQAFKKEYFGLAFLRNDSLFVRIINTKVSSADGTAINTNISNDWMESELSIPTIFVFKNESLVAVTGKFPLLKKWTEPYYNALENKFQARLISQKPKSNFMNL